MFVAPYWHSSCSGVREAGTCFSAKAMHFSEDDEPHLVIAGGAPERESECEGINIVAPPEGKLVPLMLGLFAKQMVLCA